MALSFSAREKRLLGVFAILAALFLWWRWTDDAPQGPRGDANGKKDEKALREAPRVRMDLLTRAAEPYEGKGRDLFKYAPRPPSAAELRRLREEAERLRREEEARQKAAAEAARLAALAEQERAAQLVANPPDPPRPQPPVIAFKYIGTFGPKEGKIAVFEDGKGLFLGRVGETVREQFKVVEIKHNTVVMGYTRPEFQSETKELPMAGR